MAAVTPDMVLWVAFRSFSALASSFDGASVTGQYAGGMTYQAIYNSGPSVVWTEILGSFSAGVNDSAVALDRKPASGREVIPATVSSVRAEFSFKLSANDLAAGTSRFDVIPEPVTISLVALGGLALAGVRRRR